MRKVMLSLKLNKILKFKVKGRRSDATKNKGKKGIAISGSTSVSAQKGKGILIDDDDSAEKDGLLIAERLERKETGKIIIPEKLNSEKVADKMKVYPTTSRKESKNPSNLEEKNNSRRSGADYDGEALLNMRIKVFWPKAKKFCAGTIDCYDPSVKMHMVNYDNGVIEILDLREVIWKPLNEAQEANLPSPSSNAKEKVNKSGEKGSKRKPDSTSSKQLAPSSSKRSKTKN